MGNVPQRLLHLNTWFPDGSTVWKGYGTVRRWSLPGRRKLWKQEDTLKFYSPAQLQVNAFLPVGALWPLASCSCSHAFPAVIPSSCEANPFSFKLCLRWHSVTAMRQTTNTGRNNLCFQLLSVLWLLGLSFLPAHPSTHKEAETQLERSSSRETTH